MKGSFGSRSQALRPCIAPVWMSNRQTGAAEVSTVPLHYVSKQGATLHGRGKHGEAEQARCHGQRNILDELWTVKSAMRVRVLLLFALAGADSRPGGSVKTICTYHVHCTRRHAALRGKARRLGATENAPSRAKTRVRRTTNEWKTSLLEGLAHNLKWNGWKCPYIIPSKVPSKVPLFFYHSTSNNKQV